MYIICGRIAARLRYVIAFMTERTLGTVTQPQRLGTHLPNPPFRLAELDCYHLRYLPNLTGRPRLLLLSAAIGRAPGGKCGDVVHVWRDVGVSPKIPSWRTRSTGISAVVHDTTESFDIEEVVHERRAKRWRAHSVGPVAVVANRMACR